MRAEIVAALLAVLPAAGCVDALLGIECEDECSYGDASCDGSWVAVCDIDWLVSSCTSWSWDEDCSDRRAVCLGASCVCLTGSTDCGGICAYLATDPNNCGGCGVRCPSGVCLSGRCSP